MSWCAEKHPKQESGGSCCRVVIACFISRNVYINYVHPVLGLLTILSSNHPTGRSKYRIFYISRVGLFINALHRHSAIIILRAPVRVRAQDRALVRVRARVRHGHATGAGRARGRGWGRGSSRAWAWAWVWVWNSSYDFVAPRGGGITRQ